MNFQEISFEGIKGVLLDFDNTFYEYAPCHDAGLRASFEEFKKIKDILYEDFLTRYTDAQKKVKSRTKGQGASHSRFLYFQKLLEQLEGKTNVAKTMELEEIYWSTFILHMKLKNDVVDFLTRCRENGVKTCLVTDLTAHVQFRKMKAIGVDTLLDFVVTSEEAGAEKPDESPFSLALEKLQLSPSEVIMIGDDNIKDIDGAHTQGVKAYMV